MQKVSQRQRFMLTLPGFMLVVAFLIGGGVEAFLTGLPTAFATGSSKEIDLPESTQKAAECTEKPGRPSFRTDMVVSSSDVMCGNLTSFWGNVTIQGEVRGDVVVIGGNADIEGRVIGNVTLYGGALISAPEHMSTGIFMFVEVNRSKTQHSSYMVVSLAAKMVSSIC